MESGMAWFTNSSRQRQQRGLAEQCGNAGKLLGEGGRGCLCSGFPTAALHCTREHTQNAHTRPTKRRSKRASSSPPPPSLSSSSTVQSEPFVDVRLNMQRAGYIYVYFKIPFVLVNCTALQMLFLAYRLSCLFANYQYQCVRNNGRALSATI